MSAPPLVFTIFILILLSFWTANYSERQGYNKGMVAATKALEPHLCK